MVITVVHQCDDSSVEALEAATVVLHTGLGQISKGGVLGGGFERLGHGNIAQNFRSNLKRSKLLGGGLERYNELLHIFKRVSYFLENMPYHFDFKEGFQLLKQRISWQSSIAVSISVTDNQTFTI